MRKGVMGVPFRLGGARMEGSDVSVMVGSVRFVVCAVVRVVVLKGV